MLVAPRRNEFAARRQIDFVEGAAGIRRADELDCACRSHRKARRAARGAPPVSGAAARFRRDLPDGGSRRRHRRGAGGRREALRANDADRDGQNPRRLGEPQACRSAPAISRRCRGRRSSWWSICARRRRTTSTSHLDAGVLDHLRPFFGFAVDEAAEMLRACRRPGWGPDRRAFPSRRDRAIASVAIWFSAATMAGGVPAGAIMPYQFSISRSGMPTSAVVGTSGAVGARCGAPSAIGRSVPALICGSRPADRGTSSAPAGRADR